jgi:hypothetical protein
MATPYQGSAVHPSLHQQIQGEECRHHGPAYIDGDYRPRPLFNQWDDVAHAEEGDLLIRYNPLRR